MNLAAADATRIVAIGASAGGLEPLEQVFSALPLDTGCSFVIVQHLSPDFRSMMGELLARHTRLPIERLSHGQTLQPDRVYLNLPRTTATLVDGKVALADSTQTVDQHRPIDRFFASLAEALGSRALAIVLSGTASDGTEGARHIREHGGQIIAQSLHSARFDSMPRAIMDAGLADASGDPATLAGLVVRWARGERLAPAPLQRIADDPVGSILALLRREHETDFSRYKQATIHRRISRRSELQQCPDLHAYYDLLIGSTAELSELYGDLLIEVTAFFRDDEAFATIQTRIVPALVERMRRGDSLRFWVAGCASGEEAYSIAMLVIERAEHEQVPVRVTILATDVHDRSLVRASAGEYPQASVEHLPAERVERFFDRHEQAVRVKSEVRNLVLFSTHDILRDTPFTRLDLISCRNLLIYFNDEAQEQVLARFHFALQPTGFLVLGPSESPAGLEHEFEVLDPRWRLYRKKRDLPLNALAAPSAAAGDTARSRAGAPGVPRPYSPVPGALLPDERTLRFRRAHTLALEQIVAQFAPPGFLLSADGDIVHVFGDAGLLLPPQQGAFSRRLTDLIRTDLRAAVFAALHTASQPAFARLERKLLVRENSEQSFACELVLSPIRPTGEDPGFLLLSIRRLPSTPSPTLSDPPAPAPALTVRGSSAAPLADESVAASDTAALFGRIAELEHCLRTSEDSLQTTIEELQSTNEELTASNEELQSTNEELHSVNEELYTVSSEHQRKIVELSELGDDMHLLLESSEIGTVHLDRTLGIKRFSAVAGSLLGLDNAMIGRHVDAIASPVEGAVAPIDLAALTRQVAASGEPCEQQFDRDERHLMVRLRASLDPSGQLIGVLISCIDLTELVTVQNRLMQIGADFRAIVEDTASFIVRWGAQDERITFCNATYAAFFDLTPEQLLGTRLRDLIPPSERDGFFAQVHAIPVDRTRHLSVLRELPDDRVTYTVGFTRAIGDDTGCVVEYQSTGQDLSDEYRYRRALEELVGIGHHTDTDPSDLLTRILTIGLRYFELDSAFLAHMNDREYRVVAVAGQAAGSVAAGDRLPPALSVCELLASDGSVLSFTDRARCQLRHDATFQASQVQAYIGVRLRSVDGQQRTIGFSAIRSRRQPFSVADESFLLLTGNWLSTLLDEHRRLGAISDQNRYYQSLYLNVPIMMFLADEQGRIIEISDRLVELLGGARADRVDTPALGLFTSDDAAAAADALHAGDCRDLAVTLDPGHGRPLECEMSCQLRDLGSLRRVRMCVLSDVSARNRALKASEEHNRRLALANENLNQFAFVASHDLQEPLRKIQQFSSFLQDDYAEQVDDDGRYHLKVIVDAAQRMSTLIKDLLEYSRTSRDSIVPRALSLRSVVDEVLDDLDLRVREAQATINVGELPTVSADPVLLRQLVANLIGNALKYRDEERSLTLSIGLEEQQHDGSSEPERRSVAFIDNGIGFDPAYAQRIFEPFARLNTVQEYAGSGIGLAICARVCEKHGWRLSADSAPGRGSTFRIALQAHAGSKGAVADSRSSERGAAHV